MRIQWPLAGLLLLLVFPLAAQAPPEEVLSNKAVIDMVTAKLPKDLIVAKIKSSKAEYDVSSSGLVALNGAKVPKDLIKLMMDMPHGVSPAKPEPPPPPAVVEAPLPPLVQAAPAKPEPSPAPKTASTGTRVAPPAPVRVAKAPLAAPPTEPGIHLREATGPLTLLEPNSYSAGKITQSLLCVGNCVKTKAVVSSTEAAIRTTDANVEFYFVFENTNTNIGNSGQAWGVTLTSPNQFLLMRLEKKSGHREVTTGSFGLYGAQSGTEDKAVVAFNFTRLKPGVYRVIPKAPLPPGEYGFFPASGGTPGMPGSTKLFDFGVDQK